MHFNWTSLGYQPIVISLLALVSTTVSWGQTDWAPNTPISARRTFISIGLDGSALLPVLSYQLAITPQWTLDALLPARLNVQYYSPNQKSVAKANHTSPNI